MWKRENKTIKERDRWRDRGITDSKTDRNTVTQKHIQTNGQSCADKAIHLQIDRDDRVQQHRI